MLKTVMLYVCAAEKSSAVTEHVRPTTRSSLAFASVPSLSSQAAAATSSGPVADGTSLAGQLAAMTAGSTLLSNAAASSRSLASLQALATASMIDKQAVTASERLKLEPASLESILPTLNGPATVAISSVSVFTTYCGDVVSISWPISLCLDSFLYCVLLCVVCMLRFVKR